MTDQKIQEKAQACADANSTMETHDLERGFIAGYNEAVVDNYSEEEPLAIIEKVNQRAVIYASDKYDADNISSTEVGLDDPIALIAMQDACDQTKAETIANVVKILDDSDLSKINSILDIYNDLLTQIKSL